MSCYILPQRVVGLTSFSLIYHRGFVSSITAEKSKFASSLDDNMAQYKRSSENMFLRAGIFEMVRAENQG